MASVDVFDVSFSYRGDFEVIHNVSATFEEGKLYVLVGPNGSGKTTLLNCIAHNLDSYKGTILVNDKDIRMISGKERAKYISYVPQSTVIDFDFTAMEIVLMGRSPYIGFFANESNDDIGIAEDCMKKTGVYHLRDKNIKEISGGERQRVLISRALCQNAPIMLLDEPASSLDIYHELNVMDILRDIVDEKGSTVICVMHDLNTAARYADYLFLMSNGDIVSKGKANEVFKSENLENVYSVKSEFVEIDGIKYILVKDTI